MDLVYLTNKHMQRRNYSSRTIHTYINCLKTFLRFCKKEPRQITKKDITDYIDRLVDRCAPGNTINVYLNALKFVMENILNKRVFFNIKYAKVPRKMPEFLSKEEVSKLFDNIENKKHKLMIKLMYSAGLRVSELTNLKVSDLYLDRDYGVVRNGKGRKDRMFIIAESLKQELHEFIKDKTSYLFEGQDGSISTRTIYEIVKKASKFTGRNIHPHTLRHSFATHLIQNGYDVYTLQPLLGHSRADTTMQYIHMANPKMFSVKSPLDENINI